MKRMLLAALVIAPLSTSCSDEQQSQSNLKEAWDRRNAPENMGYDYIAETYLYKVRLADLPMSGSLDKEPWSGDYWPTYRGGITYRWAQDSSEVDKYGYNLIPYDQLTVRRAAYLSPAEKLDIALGDSRYGLTKKERERTQVLRTVPGHSGYDPDYKIPTWEGLCHSWAPATLHFDNPGPTSFTNEDGLNVYFGSSDVKALLTYYLHYNYGRTHFLGGRCNLDFGKLKESLNRGDISLEEYRRKLNSAECRDANAGAFHIVLANQLGRLKEGFIADVTRDFEVWNQAVHRFDSKIVATSEGASPGAARGTVREVDVETAMTYTVEIPHSWRRVAPSHANRTVTYKYRLELDADGDIIGGEWYNNGTKDDRPDFLWKQEKPVFTGIGRTIEAIYNKSVADLPSEGEDSDGDEDGRDEEDGDDDRDDEDEDGGREDDDDSDGGRGDDVYLEADLNWSHRSISSSRMRVDVSGTVYTETAYSGRFTFYTRDGRRYIHKRFLVIPGRSLTLNATFPKGQFVGASFLAFDRDGRSLGGEVYEFAGINIPMEDLLTATLDGQ